jgi:gamma-glutamylcysteine synthetase
MRPVKAELEAQLRIKLQEHEQDIAAHKAQQVQNTSKKTQDQDVLQIGEEHEEDVLHIGDEHEQDVLQEGAKQASTMHKSNTQKSTAQVGTKQNSIQASRAMPPPSVFRKTKRSDTPTPSRRGSFSS